MTEKEIRLIVSDIIEEAKKMPVGTIKQYRQYNFSIERKKVYYFNDITGLHMTGSATGLSQWIRKAVTEKAQKDATA
jgi:hypothetical protein